MFPMYRAIMDSNVNPLRALPAVQRFQIMLYLSMIWTTIFCAGAGAWLWYGELIVAHMLIVLGVLFTGLTFQSAAAQPTHRDVPVKDGTARYDDVWGG